MAPGNRSHQTPHPANFLEPVIIRPPDRRTTIFVGKAGYFLPYFRSNPPVMKPALILLLCLTSVLRAEEPAAAPLPGNPAERGVPGTNTGPAAAGNGAGPHGALTVTREAAGWRVTGTHAGQKVNVTLQTNDLVPTLTIG